MTDNEKLARWQGYTFVNDSAEGCVFTPPSKPKAAWQPVSRLPDYLNDDAAAMSLLDTLVEKELLVILRVADGNTKLWRVAIYDKYCDNQLVEIKGKPTRHEAVVAAVLELIEKENV